jgi:hypothetical protein
MRAKVFGLASVALLSCRAVLGIEDIPDTKDAGGTGPMDAGGDATKVDAPPDGTPPAKEGGLTDVSACVSSADCRQCCRMTYGQTFGELEKVARDTQCLCGSGACTSDCASSACNTPPQPPAMGACGKCVDDSLAGGVGACGTAIKQCQANGPACEPAATCIAACP